MLRCDCKYSKISDWNRGDNFVALLRMTSSSRHGVICTSSRFVLSVPNTYLLGYKHRFGSKKLPSCVYLLSLFFTLSLLVSNTYLHGSEQLYLWFWTALSLAQNPYIRNFEQISFLIPYSCVFEFHLSMSLVPFISDILGSELLPSRFRLASQSFWFLTASVFDSEIAVALVTELHFLHWISRRCQWKPCPALAVYITHHVT